MSMPRTFESSLLQTADKITQRRRLYVIYSILQKEMGLETQSVDPLVNQLLENKCLVALHQSGY